MEKSIKKDYDNTRLDRWLMKNELVNSVVEAQKMIRSGKIRINNQKVKINARVFTNNEIQIPEIRIKAKKAKNKYTANEQDTKLLLDSVIYKDENVIVINKPAGLAVQGGSGSFKNLDSMLDVLKFDSDIRPKLVHRLDKHTSGALILARNNQTSKKMLSYFKDKKIKKTYWAWVVGCPKNKTGEIDAPLLKKVGDNEKVIVSPRGKDAVTKYKVIKEVGGASLVELTPLTGRTHQLRVHMNYIGHPIIGDGKYGGAKSYLKDFSDKMHLHAKEIEFPNPDDETKTIKVEANEPACFDR